MSKKAVMTLKLDSVVSDGAWPKKMPFAQGERR
jgi:hypothetical protein